MVSLKSLYVCGLLTLAAAVGGCGEAAMVQLVQLV
jgi:hypothetical protein